MIRLHNRGDTIVEVLIAIAIVSLVLGGAYVSANRSLQGSRASQERAEATKLTESQLERLKVAVRSPANAAEAVFAAGNISFCVADDLRTPDVNNLPEDAQSDNFTLTPGGTYPPECVKTLYGGSYSYYLSVVRVDTTFTVRVRWDRAGGSKDEVKMVYRLRE